MNTDFEQLGTTPLRSPPSRKPGRRVRVIVMEENPLTAWAIDRALEQHFNLTHRSSLVEAQKELVRDPDCLIVVGSPLADDHPEEIIRFANTAPARVVALVSDPNDLAPTGSIRVLEKPFDLTRLTSVLIESVIRSHETNTRRTKPTHAPEQPHADPLAGEAPLEVRLRDRFEREVCPVCVHRTADGGCTAPRRFDHIECPVFEWAEKIAGLVQTIDSPRLEDYLERIQSIICPECMQNAEGACTARERLDCPVDLYLGLIVPIIEDELQRELSNQANSD